jgi:protein-disulfide isomerase
MIAAMNRLRWMLPALGLLMCAAFASAQPVDGPFTAVGPVPARRSAATVTVEVFINFTCPHCNDFRTMAKPVFQKHGKRLKMVLHPILFPGQGEAPLRLFFVAQAHGKGEQMETALFEAAFNYGVNIYDPAVVNYLARGNDLADAYQKEGGSEAITGKIAASRSLADKYGVNSTPSLVLQKSLLLAPDRAMSEFVAGFDGVVGKLLK